MMPDAMDGTRARQFGEPEHADILRAADALLAELSLQATRDDSPSKNRETRDILEQFRGVHAALINRFGPASDAPPPMLSAAQLAAIFDRHPKHIQRTLRRFTGDQFPSNNRYEPRTYHGKDAVSFLMGKLERQPDWEKLGPSDPQEETTPANLLCMDDPLAYVKLVKHWQDGRAKQARDSRAMRDSLGGKLAEENATGAVADAFEEDAGQSRAV